MRRLTQSIRFRLTVLYSALLFALAATALGVTYLAVERATDPKPVTQQYRASVVKHGVTIDTLEVAEVDQIESAVNFGTLQTLRTYSLFALGGLLVASLGIGWVLSGRALRPVGAIARTTREIQATDLSRRIRLGGAKDELRDLADTIDSMLDRLDDAFRNQRELIDDASHELRSPLAVIRANLDASLVDAPEATADERARAVTVIDRAATRMSRLVEDLLATARRDAGGLADTDVDLGAVAREAGEEYAAVAAASQVFLAYDVRPGLTYIGDHDALRRAVGNLLSNAVRLSPEGGTVTVAAGTAPGWRWIAVADHGPGIAAGDQARVFDRFWRAPGADGGRDRRTGLGLAIVRQIVESHGGQVALHSTPGRGSTFVLWLPLPTAEGPPPAEPPV
ncbi:HAMP domain-containing sensor histidine kinase [Asanoa sp. WMMD1127]|uniref:sensor histidine kinase n=1 Tax=Asanoa sp. WMMD1127 TaxID=3016107 RepID=UPI002416D7B4|nr:HAMP domain-containing sensor histidine kinase [Asanoa sp. WMMD1127]MDG4824173.1 HAMP domain-containing sensor histidine kinase [Asanoa sp. WMMD1127]